MKKKKGRPSAIVTQTRRQRAIELLNAGARQTEVAKELGISPVAVCKALKKLRETMTYATAESYEARREVQRKKLIELYEAICAGLPSDVGNSLLSVLKELSNLDGLNAPHRMLSIRADVGNEQTKGFYVEFARRTMKLKHKESWDRLWAFIDSMPDDYKTKELTA